MNYKYCIKERIEKLAMSDYRKIKTDIIEAMRKTRRAFDSYCTNTADEFSDIPALDLDIIASFLGCKADELKNYEVNKSEIKHRITRKR